MNFNFGLRGIIKIEGVITLKSGLHIGAAPDTVEIGGIDSPVVKHPITKEPYIPGSSLKGKMRSLMEKTAFNNMRDYNTRNNFFNSNANKCNIHACSDVDYSFFPNEQPAMGARKCPICRVYGSVAIGKKSRNHPARIIVSDCPLAESDDSSFNQENDDNKYLFKNEGDLFIYEAKSENIIDRLTAAATPRTIERVPAGNRFHFTISYKFQGEYSKQNGLLKISPDEITLALEDIKNIFSVLNLIRYDGLGGSISRGSGQVSFQLSGDKSTYTRYGSSAEPFLPKTNEGNYVTDLEALSVNPLAELKTLLHN